METIQWKPSIKKWYNVKEEAYKIVFNEAKERFEDVLGESESVTNKSVKILTALVSILGFFVGYLITNKLFSNYILILTPVVVIDIILLYKLITPKKIILRGLPPNESIPENLDNKEDENYQCELVYYQCIVHYQNNICELGKRNEVRISNYKWALILFFISLSIIIFFITLLFTATLS